MPISHAICRILLASLWLVSVQEAAAQRFNVRTVCDSLSYIELHTDSTTDCWPLRFPLYRWCTGDVDGDGIEEVLVGVVKTTRFDPTMARRLFIFKNLDGMIRPMWMGSRLGGILQDFRFVNGKVWSLQTTLDNRYVVLEHRWRAFGLGAEQFIARGVDREEAYRIFYGKEDVTTDGTDKLMP